MSGLKPGHFEAWRQLAQTPFGPIPTFRPGEPARPFVYDAATAATVGPVGTVLLPGGTTAHAAGAALTLRPAPTSNLGPFLGLGACIAIAFTGIGVVVLIGYLIWFFPRIQNVGKQTIKCPSCTGPVAVANGTTQVICARCSTATTISWS
jgi:hypothetical protein